MAGAGTADARSAGARSAGARSAGARSAGFRGILPYAWLISLIPAITAFAVGLYGIAQPSLWRDEAYTIEAASRSPGQILALLKNADAVHGAYYMCMHVAIMVLGRSATAVRLPSVVATAVAAAFVAALSMRLGATSRAPYPRATGLLAGVLYAIAPLTSRYAQEARSYATVSALVVIASYLLVRAFEERRRRWWVAYGAAIALAGLFNLLALLILPAHGVTAAVLARRSPAGRGGTQAPDPAALSPSAGGVGGSGPGAATAGSPAATDKSPQRQVPVAGSGLRSWVAAVIVALAVLAPLAVVAYLQRGATAWLGEPGSRQIGSLVTSLAGSAALTVPIGALVVIAVVAGLAAGLAAGRHRPATVVDVALPWLVLPPAILLIASQFHPLYNIRYVVYCLPAVALLAADGLRMLASLAARYAARLTCGRAVTATAWVPSLAVVAFIAVASVAPQQAVRAPWSRPDYLRKVSKIVATYAHVGDAVLYITSYSRIVSQGYPGPFHKLRDIALAESPVASATLNGTEVAPTVLRSRFATVSRVWVISDNGPTLPAAQYAIDEEKLALVHTMRVIGHWHTRNDLLLLFARR